MLIHPSLKFPSFLILLSLCAIRAAEKCFEDRDELKNAIDSCFEGGEGAVSDYGTKVSVSANDEDCARVKAVYGWPMNIWCVGDVTNMHFLFSEKRHFNEDISDWNTSSCTDFYETFSYSSSFTGDISRWDFSKVTKTYGMFNGATLFNSDISTWDTSSLNNTQWMFYETSSFNVDLSSWDVSKVDNMWEMFCYATSFNGDVSSWDTSSAIYMEGMFYGAEAFNSDISAWDTSSVLTMREMFYGATSFNRDISNWDLSSVTRIERMFKGATSFNQNLCAWSDNFPYESDGHMFTKSGCTFQVSPQDHQSTFCASDCHIPDESSIVSPPDQQLNKDKAKSSTMSAEMNDDECSSTACRSLAVLSIFGTILITIASIHRVVVRRRLMREYQETGLEISDLTLDGDGRDENTGTDNAEGGIFTVT